MNALCMLNAHVELCMHMIKRTRIPIRSLKLCLGDGVSTKPNLKRSKRKKGPVRDLARNVNKLSNGGNMSRKKKFDLKLITNML